MTGGIILRDAENLKHFEEKLKLRTAKFDGKWISYERNTGKWSFEVSHFSKYGLDDDEEEGDVTTNNTNQTKPVPAQSAPVWNHRHISSYLSSRSSYRTTTTVDAATTTSSLSRLHL
eukprot:TRINITY_DN2169_c0_g2_i2.p1 TRINITY_DN2169_c0_g2~~TRINITY_DN2169_c0_g2_i2.p1  ORF type:complete len:117 (+),score=24.14 TRINITY_DN2169_c0_g2_i2:198-548(+)